MTEIEKDHITEQGHIVDTLIEERAERLRHSFFWPLYKRLLYPLLGHARAKRMANDIAERDGRSVFDYLSKRLTLNVEVTGLEHLPKTGRILIASSHPTGIPDGIAVFDAIKDIRPDMTFFANRDAIRAAPGLTSMIIPVEWVQDKRTLQRSRETLQETIKAFRDERCVVLFPSGRLAFMGDNRELIEQEWLSSVAIFARKYDCSIVPMHIEMRNSKLYYLFARLNKELRDITLFHELLNKKNATYKVTIGPAIHEDTLEGDANEVAAALRQYAAYDLVAGKPWKPITATPSE